MSQFLRPMSVVVGMIASTTAAVVLSAPRSAAAFAAAALPLWGMNLPAEVEPINGNYETKHPETTDDPADKLPLSLQLTTARA